MKQFFGKVSVVCLILCILLSVVSCMKEPTLEKMPENKRAVRLYEKMGEAAQSHSFKGTGTVAVTVTSGGNTVTQNQNVTNLILNENGNFVEFSEVEVETDGKTTRLMSGYCDGRMFNILEGRYGRPQGIYSELSAEEYRAFRASEESVGHFIERPTLNCGILECKKSEDGKTWTLRYGDYTGSDKDILERYSFEMIGGMAAYVQLGTLEYRYEVDAETLLPISSEVKATFASPEGMDTKMKIELEGKITYVTELTDDDRKPIDWEAREYAYICQREDIRKVYEARNLMQTLIGMPEGNLELKSTVSMSGGFSYTMSETDQFSYGMKDGRFCFSLTSKYRTGSKSGVLTQTYDGMNLKVTEDDVSTPTPTKEEKAKLLALQFRIPCYFSMSDVIYSDVETKEDGSTEIILELDSDQARAREVIASLKVKATNISGSVKAKVNIGANGEVLSVTRNESFTFYVSGVKISLTVFNSIAPASETES